MRKTTFILYIHNGTPTADFTEHNDAVQAFHKAVADYPDEHIELVHAVVADSVPLFAVEREYIHGMTMTYNVEPQLDPDFVDTTWGAYCDATEFDYV